MAITNGACNAVQRDETGRQSKHSRQPLGKRCLGQMRRYAKWAGQALFSQRFSRQVCRYAGEAGLRHFLLKRFPRHASRVCAFMPVPRRIQRHTNKRRPNTQDHKHRRPHPSPRPPPSHPASIYFIFCTIVLIFLSSFRKTENTPDFCC